MSPARSCCRAVAASRGGAGGAGGPAGATAKVPRPPAATEAAPQGRPSPRGGLKPAAPGGMDCSWLFPRRIASPETVGPSQSWARPPPCRRRGAEGEGRGPGTAVFQRAEAASQDVRQEFAILNWDIAGCSFLSLHESSSYLEKAEQMCTKLCRSLSAQRQTSERSLHFSYYKLV